MTLEKPHGYIAAAYTFCMALLFPTLVVASKGVAVIFAVLAVVSLIDLVWRGDYRRIRLNASLIPYFLLVGFALLSALWSIDPGLSLRSALHQALYPLGVTSILWSVSRLEASAARRLIVAAGAGLAATAGVVVFEWLTDFALARTLRGITPEILPSVNVHALMNTGWSGLAILIWPVVAFAIVRGRWGLGLVMLVGGCLAMALGDSVAAFLALGISAVLYLVVLAWRSRVVPALMVVGFAGFLFAMPFAAQQVDREVVAKIPLGHWLQELPVSTYHRFLIIAFSGEKISERPWTGYGMNSSRVIPDGTVVVRGWREIEQKGRNGETTVMQLETFNANQLPLHPHNISLQLWLELGPVAVILVAGLIGGVVQRAQRISTAAFRAGAVASLGAWMVNSMLSFGVWQHWWVSLGGIAVILWAIVIRAHRTDDAVL